LYTKIFNAKLREFFVDVLSSFITSAKFTRHEFEEYVSPLIESDSAVADADPAARALEVAHALAFRSGLGASLFAPAHNSISAEDVKSFAKSAFSKGNIAIIGSGIDQTALEQLVGKTFSSVPTSSATTTSSTSSYFGGENRVEAHGGLQTVFIGFGTTGTPSAELATLAAHLSPTPSVKWSRGLSPITAALPQGASVQSVHLPYSDATLIGLLVQARTTADVKEAAAAAIAALKKTATGVSQDELKKAIAKAKYSFASATESREGLASLLGSQVLSGSATLEAGLASFDKVSASAFSKAASDLIKLKPTYVAVGDVKTLPYADELGL